MSLRGAAELSTILARELVEKGFKYENIEKIIKERTSYRDLDAKVFEEILFDKIEKFSKYLYVVNIETGEDYYYFTVRDLCKDTNLTTSAIQGSIYKNCYTGSIFKIERKSFSSKDLCKDKAHLFSKRIGKVKKKETPNRKCRGKYVSAPVVVIDTYADTEKVYNAGREFCEEFNLETRHLSKYIINDWKLMSRYRIRTYKKET